MGRMKHPTKIEQIGIYLLYLTVIAVVGSCALVVWLFS